MWKPFALCREELQESYEGGTSPDKEKLKQLKQEIEQRLQSTPAVSLAKARGMVYLMENAELTLHPEELFALRIAHGDGMTEFLLRNAAKVCRLCCSERAAEQQKKRALIAEMDFGHVSPDWDYLLSRGFSGVAWDLKDEREKAGKETRSYYDERIMVYEAISSLCLRFADAACEGEKGSFTAKNLRHLAKHPPETMAQAMQMILLYYVLQTKVDTVIVRSLGGLDRLLLPYYRRDLESGRFTQEQLREITKYFFFQISLMKVTANLPFSIGGFGEDGRDGASDFTLFLLRCYRELEIYDPKIHVMLHEEMKPEVLALILEMIREGKNSFVFINTPLASKALEKIGISPEDARRVTVYGCYETAAEGTEIPCTCAGRINLVSPLEEVLQGEEEFESFEALLERVLEHLEQNVKLCMDTLSSYDPYMAEVCPSLMMSPTFRSSRESGVDVYGGGAKYNNTSVVGAGLATLTDSLAAVKLLVYEKKEKTLGELRRILNANWQGEEALRQSVQKRIVPFGNNDPQTDEIACRIYRRFADGINGKKNGRGGVYRCGVFSVDWREGMGKRTSATPDGRRAGEPLSKNLAPSLGQDRKGVLAYLQSLLKLDATRVPDGSVADVVLHSSAVKGEEGMRAFRALLSTFMKKGGFALHFNVLCPEELRRAQKEPERYRNLQIRLCGWNVRFVDLDEARQEEFILQSENGL